MPDDITREGRASGWPYLIMRTYLFQSQSIAFAAAFTSGTPPSQRENEMFENSCLKFSEVHVPTCNIACILE